MLQTRISSDRVHNFNRATLAIDRELRAEFEIDLLLMPEELRRNSIVAAQFFTAGDKRVCPLCASQEGNVYPVESPEWGRMAPPLHLGCRCVLSYITSRERGVEARIEKYKPIDPDLLKKWSSKFYTDTEIREMVKQQTAKQLPFHENVTDEELDAIRYYAGRDYMSVREYLRSGTARRATLSKEWGTTRYNRVKSVADYLLEILTKYRDGVRDQALYRGLSRVPDNLYEKLKLMKSGSKISVDTTMTSWSTESWIADVHAGGWRRVKFILAKGRKRTQELDIWRYLPEVARVEREVLLKNTNFVIESIKEEIGKVQKTRTLIIKIKEI